MATVGVGTTTTYVLDSVNILQEGAGYTQNKTSISVVSAGADVKVRPNIQKWTINLFEKYYQSQQIVDDDGFVDPMEFVGAIEGAKLGEPKPKTKEFTSK